MQINSNVFLFPFRLYLICQFLYGRGNIPVCVCVCVILPLLARSTWPKSSTNLITFGNSSSHTCARKWSNVVFWSTDFVSFSCRKTQTNQKLHFNDSNNVLFIFPSFIRSLSLKVQRKCHSWFPTDAVVTFMPSAHLV